MRKRKENSCLKTLSLPVLLIITAIFLGYGTGVSASNIPAALETIVATDGSTWERVNVPGFSNNNNFSVVAMAEYQGRLYAMTRNEAQGTEVWRTSGTGWEQVLFPGGITNGIYGNTRINNVWARMIVFNGKLYFGFSSGLQGANLGSTGCEIWRYDGTTWEPVISDKRDVEESGATTGIDSCALNDGSSTATITDSAKAWATNQWAGGVLQITSGSGKYRKFIIISNTASTLTIQQNEKAGSYNSSGQETEFTNCASKTYNNPFPFYSYTLGAVAVGDTYEIGMGYDENGFGEPWNKTITAMRLFNNRLYVSTGLNYEYGGQVWYTENGDDWYVTQATNGLVNSFGNFHTDTTYPGGKKPVSSSVTDLVVSSASGTPVLYAGGTGTTGNLGGCSRMAKLTDSGWVLIVDNNVDVNTTGSNENAFGDTTCTDTNTGNFMPWSLADFNNKIFVGINTGDGTRVLYSPNGSSADGNWFYSVGGDSGIPNGFDGVIHPAYDGQQTNLVYPYMNMATNLFPFGSNLFGGLITQFVPEYGATADYLTGSQIWKTPDGTSWTQVTGNGLGDSHTVIFEGFANFGGTLYVSGSKGASSTPQGLGGAKIFRQVYPTLIELSSFEAIGGLKRIHLIWTTASEVDNAGFNIYRSESADGTYEKINESLIAAQGSPTQGAAYEYIDKDVKSKKTYYYKLEDVNVNGTSTLHGPVSATPKSMLKR
jgi:hypothetical protein